MSQQADPVPLDLLNVRLDLQASYSSTSPRGGLTFQTCLQVAAAASSEASSPEVYDTVSGCAPAREPDPHAKLSPSTSPPSKVEDVTICGLREYNKHQKPQGHDKHWHLIVVLGQAFLLSSNLPGSIVWERQLQGTPSSTSLHCWASVLHYTFHSCTKRTLSPGRSCSKASECLQMRRTASIVEALLHADRVRVMLYEHEALGQH